MMALLRRVVGFFNAGVNRLVTSGRGGRWVGDRFTVITYVGRRSGRTIDVPVGYRRVGEELRVGVEFPDVKSWWRNFVGEGRPVTVRLDGVDRTGHAVATRTAPRKAEVRIRLES